MLLSPERLISDIASDKPLPIALPPLICRMVKQQIKGRPGVRVETPLDTMSVGFYLPLHPPRMAIEYLERCGLLFAECTKLRDRIEALQLDIFNLKQAAKAREDELSIHRRKLSQSWDEEEKRLKAQYDSRVEARKFVEQNAAAIDATARLFPPTSQTDADDAWNNVHRSIDKNRLHAESLVEGAGTSDLDFQIKALAASRERTRARWQTEDTLFRDKMQMLGIGGELALETRLGGALHRYASLMNDLKEYMFSAEWGLEHVFGVWNEAPWEDLDVDAYADESIDVPLDGLGERLVRLSNAAYGFQLIENALAVSVQAQVQAGPSGQLTASLRLPLPADTDLAFVRRLRVRGPEVRWATIEISRKGPFVTRANRSLPEWIADGGDPADIQKWGEIYSEAIESVSAPALADMAAPIMLGKFSNPEGDSDSYVTDRSISYTSAMDDWTLAIQSPDADRLAGQVIWVDVIISRTRKS